MDKSPVLDGRHPIKRGAWDELVNLFKGDEASADVFLDTLEPLMHGSFVITFGERPALWLTPPGVEYLEPNHIGGPL